MLGKSYYKSRFSEVIAKMTTNVFWYKLEIGIKKSPSKLIKFNVKEGLIIYTECRNGYKIEKLEEASCYYHTHNIVDPTTGVHTQNLERL